MYCTINVLGETHILETKNVGLYTWRGGGRGSEKVYCLYTHENVDILDGPLVECTMYRPRIIEGTSNMYM